MIGKVDTLLSSQDILTEMVGHLHKDLYKKLRKIINTIGELSKDAR